jgi:hypothetical protein
LLKEVLEENKDALGTLSKKLALKTQEKLPGIVTISFALREMGYNFEPRKKKRNEAIERGEKATEVGEVGEVEQNVEYRYQETHRSLPEVSQKRKAYPSESSDAQWILVEPLFQKKDNRGWVFLPKWVFQGFKSLKHYPINSKVNSPPLKN